MRNGMSDAQVERIVMMAEEGAEVVQAVTKMHRHGAYSFHPKDRTKTPNVEHLRQEIIDNLAMIQVLLNHGDIKPITQEDITKRMAFKLKFTHHQKEPYHWNIITTGLSINPA